ncbi:MAG: hypothetical protein IKA23_05525 [Akkermansia sp.]|nr:hypothetical protein [Akkermansia sp.]
MKCDIRSQRQISGQAAIEVTVFSGEWGEHYVSDRGLHPPASGGESRCVNSQPHLMQGWSR